jgi:hypothetical protein
VRRQLHALSLQALVRASYGELTCVEAFTSGTAPSCAYYRRPSSCHRCTSLWFCIRVADYNVALRSRTSSLRRAADASPARPQERNAKRAGSKLADGFKDAEHEFESGLRKVGDRLAGRSVRTPARKQQIRLGLLGWRAGSCARHAMRRWPCWPVWAVNQVLFGF